MPGVGGRTSTPPHCFRDLPSGLVSTRADRPSGRSMCVTRGLVVIVHPCGKGCEAALATSPPGEFELRASPMFSSTEYSTLYVSRCSLYQPTPRRFLLATYDPPPSIKQFVFYARTTRCYLIQSSQ